MVELEHVNITVSDPKETAELYCRLFGWKVRWQGKTDFGLTYHVGSDTSYVALYCPDKVPVEKNKRYASVGSLNHIAVVVDDLEEMEKKVRDEGLVPGSHADYEPGRRFYFYDRDDVEIEVVKYD